MPSLPLTAQGIERSIQVIRDQRILLDDVLARLYGVPTKRLNEAVKRNQRRFPADFMFELNAGEAASLRSQIATSKGRGGRRYLPRAFTEQGVAMLSSVLTSDRAIAVNIEIMRAFVRMRRALAQNLELTGRLDHLEHKVGARFSEQEKQMQVIFEAIRQLTSEDDDHQPDPIGFEVREQLHSTR